MPWKTTKKYRQSQRRYINRLCNYLRVCFILSRDIWRFMSCFCGCLSGGFVVLAIESFWTRLFSQYFINNNDESRDDLLFYVKGNSGSKSASGSSTTEVKLNKGSSLDVRFRSRGLSKWSDIFNQYLITFDEFNEQSDTKKNSFSIVNVQNERLYLISGKIFFVNLVS